MAELNLENRTIYCCDNLAILRGINSGCIDLIYLDPPFNKRKTFSAAAGSSAEGAEFTDIFREEDVKEEWLDDIGLNHRALHNLLQAVNGIEGKSSYNFCYLAYMSIRLIECRRILQDRGSLYLHCDPTISHYLKLVLDCIFGEGNFRNEIIWHYPSMSSAKRDFPRKHDIIFRYSKSGEYIFNWQEILVPYSASTLSRAKYGGAGFERKAGGADYLTREGKIPDTVWEIPHIKSKSEHIGYPTQKPLKLLRRIIRASSNEGDIVLDPFCGSATALIAAELEGRSWIGIDIVPTAFDFVKQRLAAGVSANFATSAPKRSDFGGSHHERVRGDKADIMKVAV